MTENPDRINDPDTQIDSTIIKLAEEYASCDRRSAEINDTRANIRENAEKLGIPSKAFQHAVGMVKHMSDGERRDYQIGVNRVLKVISDRQNDLFPLAAEKIRKREERAEKVTGKEGAPDPDTNPKSKPKATSARKPKPASDDAENGDTEETGDELIARVAAEKAAEQEQREGEAILSGTPKSQSTLAREKLDKLGLN